MSAGPWPLGRWATLWAADQLEPGWDTWCLPGRVARSSGEMGPTWGGGHTDAADVERLLGPGALLGPPLPPTFFPVSCRTLPRGRKPGSYQDPTEEGENERCQRKSGPWDCWGVRISPSLIHAASVTSRKTDDRWGGNRNGICTWMMVSSCPAG